MKAPDLKELKILLRAAVILTLVVAFVLVVLGRFQMVLSPMIPIAFGLLIAAAAWFAGVSLDRDPAVATPRLDPDPDYSVPHGNDLTVRRLEEMIHGAQPKRRMTGRALGQTLGAIADSRSPDAPELSEALQRLIAEARHPDAENHQVGAIDRRTLHRYLTELARTEETPR